MGRARRPPAVRLAVGAVEGPAGRGCVSRRAEEWEPKSK